MVTVLGSFFIDAYGRVCLPPQPKGGYYGITWPNQTGRVFCYDTVNLGAFARRKPSPSPR